MINWTVTENIIIHPESLSFSLDEFKSHIYSLSSCFCLFSSWMLHFQSAAFCVCLLFGAAVGQMNNQLTDTIKALWSRGEPRLQVISLSEFITCSDLVHILIWYISIIKIPITVTVMEGFTPLLRSMMSLKPGCHEKNTLSSPTVRHHSASVLMCVNHLSDSFSNDSRQWSDAAAVTVMTGEIRTTHNCCSLTHWHNTHTHTHTHTSWPSRVCLCVWTYVSN